MEIMRGPMSPSCNGEWGLLADGFDRPPALLMPYHPPYYRALLAACGLQPVKTALAYEKTCESETPPALQRVAARLRNNPRVHVERIRKARLKHYAPTIRMLYNATWSEQWGFAPISAGELDEFLDAVRIFGREELALLAYYDQQPVGICITLPDINEILRHANGRLGPRTLWRLLFGRRHIRGCRTMLLGFLPRFRGGGLPALLYHASEAYVRAHYDYIEFSWILEDNLPMQRLIEAIGATCTKRYQLLELPLPASPVAHATP
jgi:GNAT superfamily N-acetyltransferase